MFLSAQFRFSWWLGGSGRWGHLVRVSCPVDLSPEQVVDVLLPLCCPIYSDIPHLLAKHRTLVHRVLVQSPLHSLHVLHRLLRMLVLHLAGDGRVKV